VVSIDASLLRTTVLVVVFLCTGAMATVVRLYWRNYRRAPSALRLLPLHVLMVSASTLGLQATLAWALIEATSTGAALTPTTVIRTGLYGLWSAGVLAALVVVARQQKRLLDHTAGGPA